MAPTVQVKAAGNGAGSIGGNGGRSWRHERNSTKRNICNICKKDFARNYNLKVHQRKHTGETPYLCPVKGCRDAFKWRSSMAHHVIYFHNGTDAEVVTVHVQVEEGEAGVVKDLVVDSSSHEYNGNDVTGNVDSIDVPPMRQSQPSGTLSKRSIHDVQRGSAAASESANDRNGPSKRRRFPERRSKEGLPVSSQEMGSPAISLETFPATCDDIISGHLVEEETRGPGTASAFSKSSVNQRIRVNEVEQLEKGIRRSSSGAAIARRPTSGYLHNSGCGVGGNIGSSLLRKFSGKVITGSMNNPRKIVDLSLITQESATADLDMHGDTVRAAGHDDDGKNAYETVQTGAHGTLLTNSGLGIVDRESNLTAIELAVRTGESDDGIIPVTEFDDIDHFLSTSGPESFVPMEEIRREVSTTILFR